MELRGTSDGAGNTDNPSLDFTEEAQSAFWRIIKRGSSWTAPDHLHITYYNGSSWVQAIDIEPEGRIGIKRDVHPISDATYDLGNESYRFARGFFSDRVIIGTMQTGSYRGAKIENNGNIELWRGDDGVPFIDFKTDYSTDYDCRIQKTIDHGLCFKVGGSGNIVTGMQIDAAGNVSCYYRTFMGEFLDSPSQLYIRRPRNGSGYAVGLDFQLRNSADNWTVYAAIRGRIVNATDGSETGALDFYTRKNGSFAIRWFIDECGHFVPKVDNTYDIGATSLRIAEGHFMKVKHYSDCVIPSAAPGSPEVGSMYLDDTNDRLYVYTSDGWKYVALT